MSTGKRETDAPQGRRKKSRKRHVWGYWVVILLLIAIIAGLGVQTAGSVQVSRWERQQYVAALAAQCDAVQADTEAILAGDTDAVSMLDSDLAALETLTDGNYCLWYNTFYQLHSFTENASPCADSIEGIRTRFAVIAEGISAGGELTEKGQGFLQDLGDACGAFCTAVGYSEGSSPSVSEGFAAQNAFTVSRNALAEALAGLKG